MTEQANNPLYHLLGLKGTIVSTLSVLILLFPGACMPGSKTSQTEQRLTVVEEQLRLERTQRQEDEKVTAALKDQISEVTGEFEACQTVNDSLSTNLLALSEELKKLQTELQKQKSVVSLQEQVIQLLDDTKQTIKSSLKDQISAREVEIQETDDKLKVILVDQILFDSGSVEIKPEGQKLLMILAETFRKNTAQQIVVHGHTDNVPLGPNLREKFTSNWELSALRAAAVVRFLQFGGGLSPSRLSIEAFGATRPVASNGTQEGRTQNRRIEIVLDTLL